MSQVDRLYELLPAIYRQRDAERGGALRGLLEVIAEQLAVLDDDVAQLYDDLFIETCAEWVVPYIGDLVGARGLQAQQTSAVGQRAQVAHTLAYRRRKGTAAVLEQIARDVTGFEARAVEYFSQLSATQHVKHIRANAATSLPVRQSAALAGRRTPFNSLAHTFDARRIGRARGQYNVPNVGIFVWRQRSVSLADVTAVRVDDRRYLFNPLGCDAPLFRRPQTEEQIVHLAEPANAPLPITRRELDRERAELYGLDRSLLVTVDGAAVPFDQIHACDLSDAQQGWGHRPTQTFGVDPELGRLAIPTNRAAPTSVRVSFHYGFSADIGGGEYDRAGTLDAALLPVDQVPTPRATVRAAVQRFQNRGGSGSIEITDSATYTEATPLVVNVPAGQRLEVRARDARRPLLALGDQTRTGELRVNGGADSELSLNGLVISGGPLRITGQFRRVRIRHCTLVPGHVLAIDGAPVRPTQPSILVESVGTTLEIERSIVGGIRSTDGSTVRISDSIVDATRYDRVAYSAPGDTGAGARLELTDSTVIGTVDAAELEASNALFVAPVYVVRRQQGFVRFSFVPSSARVPRRYRCQPERGDEENSTRPQFTSTRYGTPGYAQLSPHCPHAITRGADDESEMGAFHHMRWAQREGALRTSLAEFLPFGMEAGGIFYAT